MKAVVIMKNMKMIIWIAALVMAAALLAGCGGGQKEAPKETPVPAASVNQTPVASGVQEPAAATPTPQTPVVSGTMDENKAIEIALQDAGVNKADAVIKKAALDQDLDGNDVPHYDVDFYAKDMEYEYDIDPNTGAILKVDMDMMTVEDYIEMNTLMGAASGGAITKEKALELALAAAGVSMNDISRQDVGLDTDDYTGAAYYDVEFHVGQMEYSFHIDPTTGAILKSEAEYDD